MLYGRTRSVSTCVERTSRFTCRNVKVRTGVEQEVQVPQSSLMITGDAPEFRAKKQPSWKIRVFAKAALEQSQSLGVLPEC